jgi:hypothetical protein
MRQQLAIARAEAASRGGTLTEIMTRTRSSAEAPFPSLGWAASPSTRTSIRELQRAIGRSESWGGRGTRNPRRDAALALSTPHKRQKERKLGETFGAGNQSRVIASVLAYGLTQLDKG